MGRIGYMLFQKVYNMILANQGIHCAGFAINFRLTNALRV
jgi:hypothetical protein